MLILQDIRYSHPGKELLFTDISLAVNRHDKIALIGNNGAGKSTLLRIMAGLLAPASGTLRAEQPPYYIPQHFGQYNDRSIAEALHIDGRLRALRSILAGDVTEATMSALDDDWGIEERCQEALAHWGLQDFSPEDKLSRLSGGEKTKVFLAGIAIHRPALVLLDEPSNHLDASGRQLLYDYVATTNDTLVVVSHDRHLLNLLGTVCELGRNGMAVYGGNYDFYAAQKAGEAAALRQDLKNTEKALRKARETARETAERQQKLDARGRKKQDKAGLPTISLNTLRNNAEKSTARTKEVHAEKTGAIAEDLAALRRELPGKDRMKIGFEAAGLHGGKLLLKAKGINADHGKGPLWKQPLHFEIRSGERIAIRGRNGSGKTSLIRLLLGADAPSEGTLARHVTNAIYIDQDYSLIDNACSVFGQAQRFNSAHLQEHEVKSRLTHFLFGPADWDKRCSALSGGERMRLVLCCLTLSNEAPALIVLDEPTNNLDIHNTDILTAAIGDYAGTLIVVSHDAAFLEAIGAEREITLD